MEISMTIQRLTIRDYTQRLLSYAQNIGEFLQTPSNHIYARQDCPMCNNEARMHRGSLTNEEFIEKATKIHR